MYENPPYGSVGTAGEKVLAGSEEGSSVPDYEVAVVGAGPAGATVARELAGAGARVALLERARLPRYKSCAGGIPLRTRTALPFSIDAVVEDVVSGIDVTYRGRRGFRQGGAEPFAVMVMRDRFDQLLAEQAAAAGAEIVEGASVTQIDRDGSHFLLRSSRGPVRSELVVGADGANSIVARSAGLGSDLAAACAIEAEVRAPLAQMARWRGLVNVDLGYRPAGYGWVFPKDQLLSIGLVLPAHLARSLRAELAGYLARLGLLDAEADRVAGHKVLFRRGNERIAGSGVLLTGDAAGMVDEFTEEGIYYAVRSGQIAARFITRALGGGHSWLGAYERAIDRELMPELAAARTIARLFFGTLRHAIRAMMLLSAHIGYLWGAFFRVQRGESTYREELRRARIVKPLARLLLR